MSNNSMWHQIPAGTLLLDTEQKELDSILPGLYGYHLLQLAPPELAMHVESSLITHKVKINNDLIAHNEALPILNDSIDVVVLTHALEQWQAHGSHPHKILREAYRVLIPGGHIVITGVNPFSLWGLRLWFDKKLKLLSPHRIKDWLSLLDFEVTDAKCFYFKPPLAPSRLMQKLEFLERIGSKFFPILGGAYTLVAVKRIVPLTLVKPDWSKTVLGWAEQGESAS